MKKIISILVLTFFIFLGTRSVAHAIAFPFGGLVTSIQPCNTGLLIYVQSMMGLTPYMWLTGNLPFMMYVPPHPGQYVLGMASTIVPCVLGTVPMGAGAVILFHGSSL